MAAYYRVNFEIATNEDLRQSFVLTNNAASAVNLTGAGLKMDVEFQSGVDVLELTIANGRIVIANAAAGEFQIAVPASIIGTLAPGSYQHDMVLTAANGEVHRIWTGSLTLVRGVTE